MPTSKQVALLGSSYCVQAQAIFRAFTAPPTGPRKSLINKTVVSLISAGLWSKLDAIYFLAGANSQAALINWKNPGAFNASVVNSLTFTVDRGYTGDGVSGYIETGFNPTTATSPNWSQDSATCFGWCIGANVDGQVFGQSAAGFGTYAIRGGTSMFLNINGSGGSELGVVGNPIGLTSITRPAAASMIYYKNGSSSSSNSVASSAVANATIRGLFAQSSANGALQLSVLGMGSGTSATDNSNLNTILSMYLTGVGAI